LRDYQQVALVFSTKLGEGEGEGDGEAEREGALLFLPLE